MLSAEVLKYRLTRLKGVIEKRRRNANIYRKIIKPGHVFIPYEKPHETVSYVMFLVQADDRDGLQAYLADHGVQTLVYYGTALHLQQAAAKLVISAAIFRLRSANAIVSSDRPICSI